MVDDVVRDLVHSPDLVLGLLAVGHQDLSVPQQLGDQLLLLLVVHQVGDAQVHVRIQAANLGVVAVTVFTIFALLLEKIA